MTSVLGLDPSLCATRVAAGGRSWTITTNSDDPRRLDVIYRGVLAAVEEAAPVLTVIEDLPSHARTAGLTGMAQGALRLALLHKGVPCVTVPPATLKKYATGKGNSTKPDMRVAWLQRAGFDVRDDNRVDALWLQQVGLGLLDDPAALVLPATHTAALGKLCLPVGVSTSADT